MLAVGIASLLFVPDSTVIGTVFLPNGKPAAGAEIGTSFSYRSTSQFPHPQIGYGEPAIKTDDQGNFSIPRDQIYNGALVFRSEQLLATQIVSTRARLRVQLSQPRTVTIRVSGPQPEYSSQLAVGKAVIGYFQLSKGANKIIVPSEPLRINLFSELCEENFLSLGQTTTEGVVNMKLTKWAKFVGKPFPSIKFQNSSIDGFSTSSLKGKWVLLDFWATWCRPCVAEMKELIRFYDESKSLRNQFEIVGIHNPDAKSLEAIRPQFSNLVKDDWGGLKPSYPLVFDSKGETMKELGISALPTVLLIDPQGKLVGRSSLTDLKSRLLK